MSWLWMHALGHHHMSVTCEELIILVLTHAFRYTVYELHRVLISTTFSKFLGAHHGGLWMSKFLGVDTGVAPPAYPVEVMVPPCISGTLGSGAFHLMHVRFCTV